MHSAYALYFDSPGANWERARKRVLLCVIVAAHLALIAIALRPLASLSSKRDIISVVLLNDWRPRSITTAPLPQKKAESRKHQTTHKQEVLAVENSPVQSVILDQPGTGEAEGAPQGEHRGTGSVFGPFRPPQVVHRARISYPKAAIVASAEGEVDVLVTISSDGALVDATVQRSSGNTDLDLASQSGVRQYTYRSAEKNGIAIQAQAIVTVEWKITAGERYELSRAARFTPPINLDAELKSVEFLQSIPSRRVACDKMKNPDCLATPTYRP